MNLDQTESTPSARVAGLMNELRPAERLVAEIVRDDPHAVIELSAQELAERIGIARTSVIRSAQRLGYPGYSQLRVALTRQLARAGHTVIAAAASSSGIDYIRAEVLRLAAALPYSVELLDPRQLEESAAIVLGARRVLCVANGLSGPLANDLAMRLSSVGRSAEYVSDVLAQQIASRHLGAEDVLVVISGSGANELSLRSARAAQAAGTRVIAVTSFARSPLVRQSDLSLVIAQVQESFRDELEHTSRIGHAVFLDAFVALITHRLEAAGRSARDRSLEVLGEHLVDEGDDPRTEQ